MPLTPEQLKRLNELVPDETPKVESPAPVSTSSTPTAPKAIKPKAPATPKVESPAPVPEVKTPEVPAWAKPSGRVPVVVPAKAGTPALNALTPSPRQAPTKVEFVNPLLTPEAEAARKQEEAALKERMTRVERGAQAAKTLEDIAKERDAGIERRQGSRVETVKDLAGGVLEGVAKGVVGESTFPDKEEQAHADKALGALPAGQYDAVRKYADTVATSKSPADQKTRRLLEELTAFFTKQDGGDRYEELTTEDRDAIRQEAARKASTMVRSLRTKGWWSFAVTPDDLDPEKAKELNLHNINRAIQPQEEVSASGRTIRTETAQMAALNLLSLPEELSLEWAKAKAEEREPDYLKAVSGRKDTLTTVLENENVQRNLSSGDPARERSAFGAIVLGLATSVAFPDPTEAALLASKVPKLARALGHVDEAEKMLRSGMKPTEVAKVIAEKLGPPAGPTAAEAKQGARVSFVLGELDQEVPDIRTITDRAHRAKMPELVSLLKDRTAAEMAQDPAVAALLRVTDNTTDPVTNIGPTAGHLSAKVKEFRGTKQRELEQVEQALEALRVRRKASVESLEGRVRAGEPVQEGEVGYKNRELDAEIRRLEQRRASLNQDLADGKLAEEEGLANYRDTYAAAGERARRSVGEQLRGPVPERLREKPEPGVDTSSSVARLGEAVKATFGSPIKPEVAEKVAAAESVPKVLQATTVAPVVDRLSQQILATLEKDARLKPLLDQFRSNGITDPQKLLRALLRTKLESRLKKAGKLDLRIDAKARAIEEAQRQLDEVESSLGAVSPEHKKEMDRLAAEVETARVDLDRVRGLGRRAEEQEVTQTFKRPTPEDIAEPTIPRVDRPIGVGLKAERTAPVVKPAAKVEAVSKPVLDAKHATDAEKAEVATASGVLEALDPIREEQRSKRYGSTLAEMAFWLVGEPYTRADWAPSGLRASDLPVRARDHLFKLAVDREYNAANKYWFKADPRVVTRLRLRSAEPEVLKALEDIENAEQAVLEFAAKHKLPTPTTRVGQASWWKTATSWYAALPSTSAPKAGRINPYFRALLTRSDTFSDTTPEVVRFGDTVLVDDAKASQLAGPRLHPLRVEGRLVVEESVQPQFLGRVVGVKGGKLQVQPMEFVGVTPRRRPRGPVVEVELASSRYIERGRAYYTRYGVRGGKEENFPRLLTRVEWKTLHEEEAAAGYARDLRYSQGVPPLLDPPAMPTLESFDFSLSDVEALPGELRPGRMPVSRAVPIPHVEDAPNVAAARVLPSTPKPAAPESGTIDLPEADIPEVIEKTETLRPATLEAAKKKLEQARKTLEAFRKKLPKDESKLTDKQRERLAKQRARVEQLRLEKDTLTGARNAEDQRLSAAEALPEVLDVAHQELKAKTQPVAETLIKEEARVKAEVEKALRFGGKKGIEAPTPAAVRLRSAVFEAAEKVGLGYLTDFHNALTDTLARTISKYNPTYAETPDVVAANLSVGSGTRETTAKIARGLEDEETLASRVVKPRPTTRSGQFFYRAVPVGPEKANIIQRNRKALQTPVEENVAVTHYGNEVEVLKAAAHGTGARGGEFLGERAPANFKNYLNRVMFYLAGDVPESVVATGTKPTTFTLKAKLYDLNADPDQLKRAGEVAAFRAKQAGRGDVIPINETERIVHDLGYDGYRVKTDWAKGQTVVVLLNRDVSVPKVKAKALVAVSPRPKGLDTMEAANIDRAIEPGSRLRELLRTDVERTIKENHPTTRVLNLNDAGGIYQGKGEHSLLALVEDELQETRALAGELALKLHQNEVGILRAALPDEDPNALVVEVRFPNKVSVGDAVEHMRLLGLDAASVVRQQGDETLLLAWFPMDAAGQEKAAVVREAVIDLDTNLREQGAFKRWQKIAESSWTAVYEPVTYDHAADTVRAARVGRPEEELASLINRLTSEGEAHASEYDAEYARVFLGAAAPDESRATRHLDTAPARTSFREQLVTEVQPGTGRASFAGEHEQVRLPKELGNPRVVQAGGEAHGSGVEPGTKVLASQVRPQALDRDMLLLPNRNTLDDLRAQNPDAQVGLFRHIGLVVRPNEDTTELMMIYPLSGAFGDTREEVETSLRTWLEKTGWNYRIFGPDENGQGFTPPNFKDFNYQNKNVWIMQPRGRTDGWFKDDNYTFSWRVTHEVAHGYTNDAMTELFGGIGKRQGVLGIPSTFKGRDVPPLTLADAMRAVEWEHVTFKEQRRILQEELGITISDDAFRRENSVNTADAVYRVLTGSFFNPGDAGVVPTNINAEHLFRQAKNTMRAAALEMGLDMAETFGKTEAADRAALHATEGRAWVYDEVARRLEAGASIDDIQVWLQRAGGSKGSAWADGVGTTARSIQFTTKDPAFFRRLTILGWVDANARADELLGLSGGMAGRQWWQALGTSRLDKQILASAPDPSKVRGYIEFAQDGRASISLVDAADAGTYPHEMLHFLRRALGPDDLHELERAYGVENGVWTISQEERWSEEGVGVMLSILRGGTRIENPEILQELAKVKGVFRASEARVPSEATTRILTKYLSDVPGVDGAKTKGRGDATLLFEEMSVRGADDRAKRRNLFLAGFLDRLQAVSDIFSMSRDTLDRSLRPVLRKVLRDLDGEVQRVDARLVRAHETQTGTGPNTEALSVLRDDTDYNLFGSFEQALDTGTISPALLDMAADAYLDLRLLPGGLSASDLESLRDIIRNRQPGDLDQLLFLLHQRSEELANKYGLASRALRTRGVGDVVFTKAAALAGLQNDFLKKSRGLGAVLGAEDAKLTAEAFAGSTRSDRGMMLLLNALTDPKNYTGDFAEWWGDVTKGLRPDRAPPFSRISTTTSGRRLRSPKEALDAVRALEDSEVYVPRAVRRALLAQVNDALTVGQPALGSQMLARFWKQTLTVGSGLSNPVYYLNNVFGDFDQVASVAGLDVAFKQTARNLLQNILAVPGAANTVRLVDVFRRVRGGTTLRETSDLLAKVTDFVSFSHLNSDVGKVMDAEEVEVFLGGKTWRARDLHRIAARAGIPDTFETSQLAKALSDSFEEFGPVLHGLAENNRAIRDMSNLISTRQRFGVFLTLVDSGSTPEEAAKLTVDALYDYRHSLHPVERGILQVFHPFWSFEKNNTLRTARAFLQPGAWTTALTTPVYRIKAVAEMKESAAELLTYAFDPRDEYGFDTSSMTPEERQQYAEFQRAWREQGLTSEQVDQLLSTKESWAGTPLASLRLRYWYDDPVQAALPDWMRRRYVTFLPYSRQGSVLNWLRRMSGLEEGVADDWRTVPFPDDANVSGLTMPLMLVQAAINGAKYVKDNDRGAYDRMTEAAKEVVGDPTRHPLVAVVMAGIGKEQGYRDRALPPGLGRLLARALGPTVAEVQTVAITGQSETDVPDLADRYMLSAGAAAMSDLLSFVGPVLAGATAFEKTILAVQGKSQFGQDGTDAVLAQLGVLGVRSYPVSKQKVGSLLDREADARMDDTLRDISPAATFLRPASMEQGRLDATDRRYRSLRSSIDKDPQAARAELLQVFDRVSAARDMREVNPADILTLRAALVIRGVDAGSVSKMDDYDVVRIIPALRRKKLEPGQAFVEEHE